MSAHHVIVPELRLVVSWVVGAVTAEDIEGGRRRLRADPGFDPSYRHLIDLRGVAELGLAVGGVRRLAGATTFAAGSRQAIVAAHDLAFGLARMYQGLAGPLDQQVQVFRCPGEALEWLGSSREELDRYLDLDAGPGDGGGGAVSPSR